MCTHCLLLRCSDFFYLPHFLLTVTNYKLSVDDRQHGNYPISHTYYHRVGSNLLFIFIVLNPSFVLPGLASVELDFIVGWCHMILIYISFKWTQLINNNDPQSWVVSTRRHHKYSKMTPYTPPHVHHLAYWPWHTNTTCSLLVPQGIVGQCQGQYNHNML